MGRARLQGFFRLLIIPLVLMHSLETTALAKEVVKTQKPVITQYSGVFNENMIKELINDNQVTYQGLGLKLTTKDYTYFLGHTEASITSKKPAEDVYIQLKSYDFGSGLLDVFVDNKYLGQFSVNDIQGSYLYISNLAYRKHKIVLKQRFGTFTLDWVGFGLKLGDFNPPYTKLITSPEVINNIGVEDNEVSFISEDEMIYDIEPSGVLKTMFSLNDGPWLEYEEPLNLPLGQHLIKFYSIDCNKNAEKVQQHSIIINSKEVNQGIY